MITNIRAIWIMARVMLHSRLEVSEVDRLRRERMEQAEKDARSMMVKITIPLALFFLPSIGILLLGPGLVQILHGLTAA